MKIIFDVQHLYYLPQYLPVLKELTKRGFKCSFVFYRQDDMAQSIIYKSIAIKQKLTIHWHDNWQQALAFYQGQAADWIVFGNAVSDLDKIHAVSKTVLMQHGIGPKQCYYDVSENLTTVRFVEGQHRLKLLCNKYPKGNFIDTGYAKLDPAFNGTANNIKLTDLGLDPNKPTLLYAPTFYPSSIEHFSNHFAEDFTDYNIIIKPHFFSLTSAKYNKHRCLLEYWQKADNVYLATMADYNLLPFMIVADAMLSDASSAIFEFAALNKPVIWCDFYKLRWSYRGIFSFRFKKRINSDIKFFHELTSRAKNYQALKKIVAQAIKAPQEKAKERATITKKLAGKTDGKASIRIADYLESKSYSK
jgi:hypothetical protein